MSVIGVREMSVKGWTHLVKLPFVTLTYLLTSRNCQTFYFIVNFIVATNRYVKNRKNLSSRICDFSAAASLLNRVALDSSRSSYLSCLSNLREKYRNSVTKKISGSPHTNVIGARILSIFIYFTEKCCEN